MFGHEDMDMEITPPPQVDPLNVYVPLHRALAAAVVGDVAKTIRHVHDPATAPEGTLI